MERKEMISTIKISKEALPNWAGTVGLCIDGECFFPNDGGHVTTQLIYNAGFYPSESFSDGKLVPEEEEPDIDYDWFALNCNRVDSKARIYNYEGICNSLPEKYGVIYHLIFDVKTKEVYIFLYNQDTDKDELIQLPETLKINLIIE